MSGLASLGCLCFHKTLCRMTNGPVSTRLILKKQLGKSLNSRNKQTNNNKLIFSTLLRQWWHKSSQWGKWLAGICFQPCREGHLSTTPHSSTHSQFLDPDSDSSSGNTNPHRLATNLPVPEHSADHILGALFSCGSLYILGLGSAVKNQVQYFLCFHYAAQLYASNMPFKLFFSKITN